MKRVFLLVVVVIVASTWARPAHAQLGILDLGTGVAVSAPLDNQKNMVKKKQSTSLPPPPVAGSTRAFARHSALNLSGIDDHRFGRIDMSGHPLGGYPVLRGDVSGPNAARVSRGGANGGRRGR